MSLLYRSTLQWLQGVTSRNKRRQQGIEVWTVHQFARGMERMKLLRMGMTRLDSDGLIRSMVLRKAWPHWQMMYRNQKATLDPL